MQYGLILRSSLEILKRHKYFVFLAWLAGEIGSNSFSFNSGNSFRTNGGSPVPGQASQWFSDNAALILEIGLIVLVIAIVFWVFGRIATGALYSAQAKANSGARVPFGEAWAMGRLCFRRLALFDLAVIGIVLLAVLTFVLLIVLAFSGGAGLIAIPLIFLFVIAFIAAAIITPIPIAWARRGIVLDSLRGKAAFWHGWHMLWNDFGSNVLLALMMIGIGIVIGICTLIITAVIALPLILSAIDILGSGAVPNWGFIVAYGLFVLVIYLVLASIGGAYRSTCWTLAYLQLRAKALAPKPVAPAMVSHDLRWYWDGHVWQPVPPPGSPISPDGLAWWNGYSWLPLPPKPTMQ